MIFAFGSVIFGGLYPCSGFAGFTGSNGVPFPSFGVYPSLWGIIWVISPVFVGSFGSLGNGIGSPSLPVVGSTGIQLPIFVYVTLSVSSGITFVSFAGVTASFAGISFLSAIYPGRTSTPTLSHVLFGLSQSV